MQVLSPQLRIGVLRGGPSPEYDVSLKTGFTVLKHFSETHRPLDIFISKNGTWHMHGVPRPPERIFPHVDVFFNALHGAYGEDGKLQKVLDHYGVKYTGSDSFSSALGMNKVLSKEVFIKSGLKTPRYISIRKNDDVKARSVEVFKTFLMPVVVKPATAGSSFGVSIVRTISDIVEAVLNAFKHSRIVLVEEYIQGKEATCGVVDDFRGQPIYALLPVEIRPKSKTFFDYDAKYSDGGSEEICPGKFFDKDKKIIEQYAKEAHKSLGLRHYSRSDFIVTPRRGVYILETNTSPGLTENSLLPKSLQAVGIPMKDFLHHLLLLALNDK